MVTSTWLPRKAAGRTQGSGSRAEEAIACANCSACSSYPLAVDDYKFRHENVATYWLSWADPGAEAAIRERTAATANGTTGGAGARGGSVVPSSLTANLLYDVTCLLTEGALPASRHGAFLPPHPRRLPAAVQQPGGRRALLRRHLPAQPVLHQR